VPLLAANPGDATDIVSVSTESALPEMLLPQAVLVGYMPGSDVAMEVKGELSTTQQNVHRKHKLLQANFNSSLTNYRSTININILTMTVTADYYVTRVSVCTQYTRSRSVFLHYMHYTLAMLHIRYVN